MEVLTIENEAYQRLIHKINTLISKLDKPGQLPNSGFTWISNTEFCKQLGITKRTAINYRIKKLISYSQVGSKIYYKSTDVESFLQRHHIKSLSQ